MLLFNVENSVKVDVKSFRLLLQVNSTQVRNDENLGHPANSFLRGNRPLDHYMCVFTATASIIIGWMSCVIYRSATAWVHCNIFVCGLSTGDGSVMNIAVDVQSTSSAVTSSASSSLPSDAATAVTVTAGGSQPLPTAR